MYMTCAFISTFILHSILLLYLLPSISIFPWRTFLVSNFLIGNFSIKLYKSCMKNKLKKSLPSFPSPSTTFWLVESLVQRFSVAMVMGSTNQPFFFHCTRALLWSILSCTHLSIRIPGSLCLRLVWGDKSESAKSAGWLNFYHAEATVWSNLEKNNSRNKQTLPVCYL